MLSTEQGLAGVVIPLRKGMADASAFAAALSTYVQDPQRLQEHAALARQLATANSGPAIAAAYGAVYRSALATPVTPSASPTCGSRARHCSDSPG